MSPRSLVRNKVQALKDRQSHGFVRTAVPVFSTDRLTLLANVLIMFLSA